MVTAAEPVYSTCSLSRQEEYGNATTHWNRSAPQPVHLLRAIGEWPELSERLDAGGSAAVPQEAAAERCARRRCDREHPVVLRGGGAACGTGGGGGPESIPGNQPLGEED